MIDSQLSNGSALGLPASPVENPVAQHDDVVLFTNGNMEVSAETAAHAIESPQLQIIDGINVTKSAELGFSRQYLNCSQHVNIQFEKLTVRVPINNCSGAPAYTGGSRKWCALGRNGPKTKTILNGISGSFRAGQLTGIMGPSGAGKTTLMNILAGYSHNYAGGGVDGIVRINGVRRDLSKFRKTACYIMQQDQLTPNLTVREMMQIVAALKLPLSRKRTLKQRQMRIDDVVDTLGLSDCLDTSTQNLSGGQRKRLVIAQELINNPPVMLFDEPTSGLDSAACLQCIAVLKKLALGGRTIICSIHQPSTRIFEMFDQIYMLSAGSITGKGGQCIYRGGGVSDMVSYFGRHGFPCPPYHNPADFVTEIASGQFGAEVAQKFAELVVAEDDGVGKQQQPVDAEAVPGKNDLLTTQNTVVLVPLPALADSNGYNESGLIHDRQLSYDKPTYRRAPGVSVVSEDGTRTSLDNSSANDASTRADEVFRSYPEQRTFLPSSLNNQHQQRMRYHASYWQQFKILTVRSFTSIYRDGTLTRLRLAAHVAVGVVMGLLYYDIGNESSKILNNAALLFFSMLFVMFGGMMPTLITFPLEVGCVLREHLNYWYSLKMYCLAKMVADVPFQCIFPLFYGVIVYWMSGQPNDPYRAALFLLCLVATSLIAQSVGFFLGAVIPSIQDAVFLGPTTAIPMLVFSGFFISLKAIPFYMRWLTYISYIRFSFEAALHAIYGYDRADLECNEDISDKYSFCFWHNGKDFLTYMNMEDARFWIDMAFLLGFFVLVRIATYFALKMRLNRSKITSVKVR